MGHDLIKFVLIELACKKQNIDTTNVEPFYTISEKNTLKLRQDKVTENCSSQECIK